MATQLAKRVLDTFKENESTKAKSLSSKPPEVSIFKPIKGAKGFSMNKSLSKKKSEPSKTLNDSLPEIA